MMTAGAHLRGARVAASLVIVLAVSLLSPAARGGAAPAVRIDTVVTTTLRVYEFTTWFNPPAVDISCEIDHGLAQAGAATIAQTINQAYCMSSSRSLTHHVTVSATGVVRRCVGVMCGSNAGLGTPSFYPGTEVRSGPFTCVISTHAVTCREHGARGFVITARAITSI